jgi:hypothetical protein
VRDDTEYEKRLAELEGREMALRAKDQSAEAEAARRSEVAAGEGDSGRDEEAEAVWKRALENENRVAIAMAEAEERIADAAEKEAMEHARGRDAASSRL